MKRYTFRGAGRLLGGYTIIEVLIFLAVSGALLLSAINLISGRQEKVRFTQSIVSLEQQFQDTFNDVSTGYYPSKENFSCRSNGADVQLIPGTPEDQGANEGCVFAGKLLHFYANTEATEYRIYTIVGLTGGTNITDSRLRLLGNTLSPPQPGEVEVKFTQADVQLEKFTTGGSIFTIQDTGDPGRRYHSLAIISEFGTQSGPNNAVSGNASNVKLYGYSGWNSNGVLNSTGLRPIVGNAIVCLGQTGTGGRQAALSITPQLTIERLIDSQPSQCP